MQLKCRHARTLILSVGATTVKSSATGVVDVIKGGACCRMALLRLAKGYKCCTAIMTTVHEEKQSRLANENTIS